MFRPEYWEPRLRLPIAGHIGNIVPLTVEKGLRGTSDAALVYCSDGNYYALKSAHNGRKLISERLVSLIAEILEYPAPKCELISVDDSLIEELDSDRREKWQSGPAHGSLWLDQVTDGSSITHHASDQNRQRFSDIALLYGMTIPGEDYQFLYEVQEPHLVWTFDHGFFMDLLKPWSAPTANGYMGRTINLDQKIISAVRISAAMFATSRSRLPSLTDELLARVIGSIPEEWGITKEERCILCEYLCKMRERFVSLKSPSDMTA